MLVVLSESIKKQKRGRTVLCHCRCDCGVEKVIAFGSIVYRGQKSCGCQKSKQSIERFTTHGLSRSRIYSIWQNMRNRCHNPRVKSFADYGARGITVCDRWHKFANFIEDMGHPPSEFHTIERKNCELGYFPKNCEWILRCFQNRNRRDNRRIEFNGQTKTLAEWCDITGLKRSTLQARVARGLTPEQALTLPLRRRLR